jgi:predicted anti-sigma-YlaC factor YlaD
MHGEYTALMSLMLDREITPEEERRLLDHLATCRECNLTWRRWRALDRRLANAPILAPPPSFVEGVMARLEQRRRRAGWGKWLGSGLVFVWGLIFCGFWLALAGLIWWAFRHPLEAGILLSTAAQLASLVSWLLRGVGTVVDTVGPGTLALGLCATICLTGCLVVLWVWVMARSQAWVRAAVPARA